MKKGVLEFLTVACLTEVVLVASQAEASLLENIGFGVGE